MKILVHHIAADPLAELTAPPDPIAVFKEPKGMEREWEGGMEWKKKGEERGEKGVGENENNSTKALQFLLSDMLIQITFYVLYCHHNCQVPVLFTVCLFFLFNLDGSLLSVRSTIFW